MEDDEHIRAWLRDRNPASLTLLLTPYETGIFSFMMRMLNHHQDAEDASQAAFIAAVTALPAYEAKGRFKSWLYQIAANEARMLLRKRTRHAHRHKPIEESDNTLAKDFSGHGAASIPTPMETLLAGERIQALQEAVQQLPEAEREVVTLRLQLDCTYEEIAEITGSPLGTVLGRMRNATRRLRLALEKEHHYDTA